MSTIPIFFQAKQITTFAVTPQSIAADGTLSDGTAFSLKTLGIFDSLQMQFSHGLTEISSADANIENYQPVKDSFSGTLSALDVNGKVNPLLDAAFAVSIIKF